MRLFILVLVLVFSCSTIKDSSSTCDIKKIARQYAQKRLGNQYLAEYDENFKIIDGAYYCSYIKKPEKVELMGVSALTFEVNKSNCKISKKFIIR